MSLSLPAPGGVFLAPGEKLDRVVRVSRLAFRARGYRVIYWEAFKALSEADCYFGLDQRDCAVDFQRLKYEQGLCAERYVVEVSPLSVTWLSGRVTEWHERRIVLLESMIHGGDDSPRDLIEFPGGTV